MAIYWRTWHIEKKLKEETIKEGDVLSGALWEEDRGCITDFKFSWITSKEKSNRINETKTNGMDKTYNKPHNASSTIKKYEWVGKDHWSSKTRVLSTVMWDETYWKVRWGGRDMGISNCLENQKNQTLKVSICFLV